MSYPSTLVEAGWADEVEPGNTVAVQALRTDSERAPALPVARRRAQQHPALIAPRCVNHPITRRSPRFIHGPSLSDRRNL
jgi:hypothetical protein